MVELDAIPGTSRKVLEGFATSRDGLAAQIFAIEMEEVEGDKGQLGRVTGEYGPKAGEVRGAGRIRQDDLAVDNGGSAWEVRGLRSDMSCSERPSRSPRLVKTRTMPCSMTIWVR